MGEVKRDPHSDKAVCDGFRRNVDSNKAVENGVTVSDFTEVAFEALPHWINRAVRAEEQLKKETESIRYVIDMLDTGVAKQRRARLHLLNVIERIEKM